MNKSRSSFILVRGSGELDREDPSSYVEHFIQEMPVVAVWFIACHVALEEQREAALGHLQGWVRWGNLNMSPLSWEQPGVCGHVCVWVWLRVGRARLGLIQSGPSVGLFPPHTTALRLPPSQLRSQRVTPEPCPGHSLKQTLAVASGACPQLSHHRAAGRGGPSQVLPAAAASQSSWIIKQWSSLLCLCIPNTCCSKSKGRKLMWTARKFSQGKFYASKTAVFMGERIAAVFCSICSTAHVFLERNA